MECNLKSPFKEAFESGDSIDYKLVPGAKKTDHDVVKEMGYKIQMNSDCSFTASGLPGFSLSSYGDWGTFFVDWGTDAEKKLFLDMCNEGIIAPWRVRKYVREGKNTVPYDYDERGWTKHSEELGKWVSTESPYKK